MGLIREPLDVDFYVDPKPLTKEEKAAISKYILDYNTKVKSIKKPKKHVSKRAKTTVA